MSNLIIGSDPINNQGQNEKYPLILSIPQSVHAFYRHKGSLKKSI